MEHQLVINNFAYHYLEKNDDVLTHMKLVTLRKISIMVDICNNFALIVLITCIHFFRQRISSR